jgi:hypothetical protein
MSQEEYGLRSQKKEKGEACRSAALFNKKTQIWYLRCAPKPYWLSKTLGKKVNLTYIITRTNLYKTIRGEPMNTKLTLQIDDQVIKSAKVFAKDHHISLSRLAENYFKMLTQREKKQPARIPGIVGELAGILKNKEIDYSKENYVDYLEKKYS